MEYLTKIFFTSDWHIGHANVIEFDKRPFKDCNHMQEYLIKQFNHYVPHDGLTYFLGDMGLCKSDTLRSVINRLNGKKILVAGNHDGKLSQMLSAGFDAVTYNASIYIGKERVTMSHCPLRGVFREDTRHMRGSTPGENWHREKDFGYKYSCADEGQFHLHGHIHSSELNGKPRCTLNQMDVGVVAWDYRPVSFKEVVEWIQDSKSK